MEAWFHSSVQWLLAELAVPEVGLSAIFFISLVSATLLPLGSEPAVFAYVKLAPHMFWPAVLVGTTGNTLGGAISYYMGRGAHTAYERWREKHPVVRGSVAAQSGVGQEPAAAQAATAQRAATQATTRHAATQVTQPPMTAEPAHAGGRWHQRIQPWLQRMGPSALLFSWLPVVGDPLCAVAGWLRLSIWPCVMYMAVGKFLRYALMTAALVWVFPSA